MVRDRPGVAGALLVGGASERFGSPKALARFEGETLAERGHRVLAEAFEEVIVVGKAADELELPFEVLDDGSDVRASIVGLAAALRLADAELVVVLPTDMPLVTVGLLRALADAAEGFDVAVPQTGPLPGAYRRTARSGARAANRRRATSRSIGRSPSFACASWSWTRLRSGT